MLGRRVYDHNIELATALIAEPAASMEESLTAFAKHYEAHAEAYQTVARRTDLPAALIAAIYWRESTGPEKSALQHNDRMLRVRQSLRLTRESTHLPALLTYAEFYNGLGYFFRGKASPYVYSGTSRYTQGKYVAGGRYNARIRDRQPGVLALIQRVVAVATTQTGWGS